MSLSATNFLYVTYVEKHGAFLRIWGQIDKNLSMVIESSLLELTQQFDQGHYIPATNNIPIGLFCCAKYKDGKYYRARVSNTVMLPQNLVEVHFIDYGNKEILPVTNIRTTNHLGHVLTNLPPQAHDFILANVTHIGPAWDNNTILLISNEIRYIELQFIVIQQVNSYTLIKLFKNGEDFALTLFNRGLVLSMASVSQTISLQNSNAPSTNIHSPISSAQPQSVMTPTPTLLSYKAVTIEPGSENNVYVSYVSDGPCQFSVQLQKLEESLARLMRELNRMPLHPLEEDPLPGTVCVAKCIEDDHICRAVVTSMVDGQYKVFYVDFGNTEVVPITNLFQIPFKYVILKVMAMRYALSGLERSSVTLEMKCAFKEFVSDKLLRMRSLPPPTRSALPLCDLWDSNNVNVLDVLKKAAMLAYPEIIQLTRGFSQEVLVSYVYSCSHFYVQLKAKEESLRKVMEELQIHCPQADKIQLSQIKPGLPCCALFDADNQWYRAQVLAHESDIVKVRYVDYGNEELVSVENLRMPIGNLLTALRPQALECCLNGYQNMGDDVERDNILEELILEKEFTMRVIEMQSSRALVDLIDNARYNVGSLLLERLASAKSQVSPLLIQESHHIEQRKRQSPISQDGRNKFDRVNSRDSDKSWGRRDSSDKGFSPKESNDRGFQPRDRDNNRGFPRKDLNERFNQGVRDKGFSRDRNDASSENSDWGRPNSKERSWIHNKQDIASNNERNNRKQESWRQEKSPRDEYKKDSWNDDGEKPAYRGKRDGFRKGGDGDAGQGFDRGFNKGKRDGFKKDSWGNESSTWKQRSPNPRESSEKSWSDGSEKSWRRNKGKDEKSFKRNDFKERENNRELFAKPRNNERSVNFKKVEDPADHTDIFTYIDLQGQTEEVVISWFHNPSNFFCQLKKHQDEFRMLMDNIQDTYCNIQPESAPVNAPVIALFPEDKVLYRAFINEVKGNQYHVQYVDFGNFATTNKVWRIEKKFMSMPAQAICCALGGITPIDGTDSWTNIDAFGSYFDKEVFTCTFNMGENNGYLVDLFYDNQSLGEALVSAGLAKSLSEEYFDSSILFGQQLLVTLGDIVSLDEFYIFLYNGVQLPCTLHNLESATETFEDTLKQYSSFPVIIYVDNVLETKLQVTLYDTTGVKIKVIEPDEGAFESVEPLCQLPVLSKTINGWVTYLTPAEEEKHKLFIQPSEYASVIVELLDRLYNQYETSTLEETLEPEEGSYYAVHSTDTNWYRGLVLNVEGDSVTMSYVDYGNSETIPKTELRELTQEFKELHVLALEVLASNIDESFNEQEVTAEVWYGDNGWEATVTKLSDAKVEEPTPEEPKIEETEPLNVAPEEQPSVIGVAVVLSHIDSPNEFYVQLQEALGEIENLQAFLQEQIDTYPDLENPAAGVLCAAPYSLDQQWYRAQVLDADSDITTVRFVDYGNTDVITNETTRVKTLPSDMLALEQHARRCSLLIKPKDDVEWSSTAHERFEALTNDQNLSVEIIHQDEKTTYVDLYANGQNVAEMLLKEDLAATLELEIQSSCSGYVSNLNSPSEFWVQLENSVADLEWAADQLLSAESFPELEDLTPGSLCAALYPEDEMWYRARILSNTVAGLEVLFIDYGNSCTCTGLRQLPEDLIMFPALAQKCSLQKPYGILQWSSQATEKLKNISADGATVFNIDKISTGETSIVRLLLDSEDISLKLLPETEKCYISYIESIYKFWILKVEDEETLDKLAEELANASEWPVCEDVAVGSTLAALQDCDETWYRAKVLSVKDSEYEVLFIDYGNVGITKDIRSYDKNDIPPLVKCYKLDPLPGFRWMDNEATEKFKEICPDSFVGTLDVEYVNEDTVRLYLNGVDVRMEMDAVSISSVQSTPKRGKNNLSNSASVKSFEADLENTTEFLELIDDSNTLDPKSVQKNSDTDLETCIDPLSFDPDDCPQLSETDQNSEEDIGISVEISNVADDSKISDATHCSEANVEDEVETSKIIDDFNTSDATDSQKLAEPVKSLEKNVEDKGETSVVTNDLNTSDDIDSQKLAEPVKSPEKNVEDKGETSVVTNDLNTSNDIDSQKLAEPVKSPEKNVENKVETSEVTNDVNTSDQELAEPAKSPKKNVEDKVEILEVTNDMNASDAISCQKLAEPVKSSEPNIEDEVKASQTSSDAIDCQKLVESAKSSEANVETDNLNTPDAIDCQKLTNSMMTTEVDTKESEQVSPDYQKPIEPVKNSEIDVEVSKVTKDVSECQKATSEEKLKDPEIKNDLTPLDISVKNANEQENVSETNTASADR